MAELVQAKLVTGEWIIGAVQNTLEKSNTIRIKQPLMIQIVQQGPDKYGLALIPFDSSNPEGTVEIFLDKIVARPESISQQLHDAYMKQTSQIAIATELEAGIAGISLKGTDKK